jgi:hypothetical protein
MVMHRTDYGKNDRRCRAPLALVASLVARLAQRASRAASFFPLSAVEQDHD